MAFEQIELISDLKATMLDHMGSQLTIVNAARVSLDKSSAELTESDLGLLKYLMKNRHASPFEHCVVQFLIEAPIFVAREWHRHRTQSYNEMSGRYTELKPVFYAPDYDRPLIQVGKPGAYRFEQAKDDIINIELYKDMRFSCQTAWNAYQRQIAAGVAKEVARMVLPVTIYTKWYATGNLRNWLNFISLRTDPQALYEIRYLAGQVETNLHKLYPDVLNNWDEFGRGGI
jgi:thymidylate synthase (FAD)